MKDKFEEKGEANTNGIRVYKHTANLGGIKSETENKFYFRCEDKATPTPNKNTESYVYTLTGSKPLVIEEVGPNGTIKDSVDLIKVTLTAKTFGGYKEGDANCYYKTHEGGEPDYVLFFNTGQIQHSQELFLPEGNYAYDIKCIDLGGNADVKKVEFAVDSDKDAPVVTRLYYENNYLKILTNEKSECVYDTLDCTYYFKDGIKMNDVDDKTHYSNWKPDTKVYIKCRDIYLNEPIPNKCTIIAKPFDNFNPELIESA
jgi:hypothetical protein